MYITTIITVAKKESERERLEMEWVINFQGVSVGKRCCGGVLDAGGLGAMAL